MLRNNNRVVTLRSRRGFVQFGLLFVILTERCILLGLGLKSSLSISSCLRLPLYTKVDTLARASHIMQLSTTATTINDGGAPHHMCPKALCRATYRG